MEKVFNLRLFYLPAETRENKKRQKMLFRERIRALYFEHHWSRSRIALVLGISWHTVQRWSQSPDQDCSVDGRGWTRGVRRVHSAQTIDRIRLLHRELTESPKQFFTGATAIDHEWRKQFDGSPPPLRTIGRILGELGLSASRSHGRSKGAAAYLHYPEHTIYTGLGGRVLEADFVGRKYLTGQREPLHFIGYSFKQAPCLRHFQRVESETASVFITETRRFFARFETPDFVKVDNAVSAYGSNSGARSVSRAVQFLLARKVVPIFSVPRRPFSQASIEGSNSVFARKFWNVRTFQSTREIDTQLKWFNDAIITYHGYEKPKRSRKQSLFTPRVLFLRQVHATEKDDRHGQISVLNERILLPAGYINYFVLAEWNLKKEKLSVYLEIDKTLHEIHSQRFRINTKNLSY